MWYQQDGTTMTTSCFENIGILAYRRRSRILALVMELSQMACKMISQVILKILKH